MFPHHRALRAAMALAVATPPKAQTRCAPAWSPRAPENKCARHPARPPAPRPSPRPRPQATARANERAHRGSAKTPRRTEPRRGRANRMRRPPLSAPQARSPPLSSRGAAEQRKRGQVSRYLPHSATATGHSRSESGNRRHLRVDAPG
eukprot:546818-Pyramimonas_sp.AAC.1